MAPLQKTEANCWGRNNEAMYAAKIRGRLRRRAVSPAEESPRLVKTSNRVQRSLPTAGRNALTGSDRSIA